jgi:hypothetical protein
MNADTFIQRWQASGAAERVNYQLFFSELCDLLGVPPPQPQTAEPDTPLAPSDSQPWPATMAERARAVRAILAGLGAPATPRQVAELLDTLAVLGQAEEGDGGVYTAV